MAETYCALDLAEDQELAGKDLSMDPILHGTPLVTLITLNWLWLRTESCFFSFFPLFWPVIKVLFRPGRPISYIKEQNNCHSNRAM